jgi:hypothetical protein
LADQPVVAGLAGMPPCRRDDCPSGKNMDRKIESRIGPARHDHAEIPWRTLQQPVDQPHRAAGQSIDLVEHEEARSGVQLYRAGQYPDLLHGRRRGPTVIRAETGESESPLLEGGGEVASQHPRRIVAVQRDPACDQPLFLPAPGDVRQLGRLAESRRRLQLGEAPLLQSLQALVER